MNTEYIQDETTGEISPVGFSTLPSPEHTDMHVLRYNFSPMTLAIYGPVIASFNLALVPANDAARVAHEYNALSGEALAHRLASEVPGIFPMIVNYIVGDVMSRYVEEQATQFKSPETARVSVEETHIPPITNPLGKNWHQPPTKDIALDSQYAMMTRATFEQLLEYSTSMPSGVYEGKMWRRARDFRDTSQGWSLCWFDASKTNPDNCRVFAREIILID